MSDDQSELLLLFEVLDTGTGFDSDGEAVMFKPFSQVDSSVSIRKGQDTVANPRANTIF
jgi:signal transduction histidine kinase